jgi:hypothetical protein
MDVKAVVSLFAAMFIGSLCSLAYLALVFLAAHALRYQPTSLLNIQFIAGMMAIPLHLFVVGRAYRAIRRRLDVPTTRGALDV